MPATIYCREEQKEDIKSIVMKGLLEAIKCTRCDSDEISYEYKSWGIDFEFPIGEIYGYTSDYVQMIPDIFREVKQKYKDVGIWGLAYEYETVTAITFGPLFYCEPEDLNIKIVYKWQECDICGDIVETDAIYNSSQWDFEEGNVACLCCPTCMLKYLLNKNCWGGLEPNASFTDDEIEEMLDNEDTESFLKSYFYDKIIENLTEYLEDFRKHKDDIVELSEREDLTEDEKELIAKILKNINK